MAFRFDTLAAVLPADARDDRSVTFVEGDGEQRTLSFRRLRQRAVGVLGALQRRGLGRGDRVVLCLSDNERFTELFWGCVLGGIVPAPLAAAGTPDALRKLVAVATQVDAAAVVTDARTLERLEAAADVDPALAARVRERAWTPNAADAAGAPGTPADVGPDDLAFVQYSSGSTAQPKGVQLTHRNLATNIASIIEAAAFTDADIALSWMPLSHDMGLIGFHLNMLACGASHGVMRTELFTRRPLLWLEQATRMRATVLCSPNFGYQHALRQLGVRASARFDLSPVRVIFNGAEPISAALCRRFMAALAPHGLKPNAMYPVYGLAEASLAVTFPRPGAPMRTVTLDRATLAVGAPVRPLAAGSDDGVELVAVGWPVPRTRLAVVDDAGAALPAGALGRILIAGDNVTRGYLNAEQTPADGWLDTGDLGVLLDDGQLVVAGRAKDIVFVNGQNIYPHDIERIAEQVAGIETNRVAAAGIVRDGSEALALFVVHRGAVADFAAVAAELVRGINRQTGLEVAAVVPVQRLPKTTSGKLQRYALAQAHARGEFDAVLAALAPAAAEAPVAGDTTLARLQAICHAIVPELGLTPQTDLMESNLSSLNLARIHEAIELEYPQRVDVTDLFDHPTLEGLAAFIDSRAP